VSASPRRPAPEPRTVAFVLVSYVPDAPAGMERAIAALAAGLRARVHRPLILTAAAQPRTDPQVIRLRTLPVTFPCDDTTLRQAAGRHQAALAAELRQTLARHRASIVVYADALWGLGRVAALVRPAARTVLAVHVVGHDCDLAPALAAAHRVIAPSASVLDEARDRGYDTATWQTVPNPLLIDPGLVARPEPGERDRLRRHGPAAVIARLGAEKGVTGLLAAAPPGGRPVHVVLAPAGFEAVPGSQQQVAAECQSLASAAGALLLPPLAWHQVAPFLARAAVTIVPSERETFGNVAAESLSAGTPVIAYATGNLPALLGEGGVLVPPDAGPRALWCAARDLLADPVRYHQMSREAYCRSRNYGPALVADTFLKAVYS